MIKITDSQDGKGWNGTCGDHLSNPLPEQVHPEQVVQDSIQVGFE